MSFSSLLYTLLIKPLQLVFEIIFVMAQRFIGHPGLAIIALSLAMNLLVLPLYRRADAMQEEARDTDKKLRRGVSHIKKTFSGDEKMMILQTYYRQNHYAPTDSLKGSISLLLEIPFFIAAYQFLSHLKDLEGVSFGPIADLALPDALLSLGGVSVNLLPILMTALNLISSFIFLKGFPLKSKIQLYGMALFFLVFLYDSPAGLVFYWTLNNLFSLVKTIFYKIPHPRRVLLVLVSFLGLGVAAFALLGLDASYARRRLFLLLAGLALELPLLWTLLKNRLPVPFAREQEPDKRLFRLGSLFAALLTGLLIPSAVIVSSPLDFVDVNHFHNPLNYLLVTGTLAAGTFLIWLQIFYGLASRKGKRLFEKGLCAICAAMLINYMFFGTGHGLLSPELKYETLLFNYSLAQQLLNLLILLLAALLVWLLLWKKPAAVRGALLTAVIAFGGMGLYNGVQIAGEIRPVKADVSLAAADDPCFTLSREGQNVVVLMLDRAMGQYIPYLFAEDPSLQERFDGFTWYGNTISHGGITNYGAPGLFGGYEYTPVSMNLRTEQKQVEKHNEALQLMPVLFDGAGFEVTVCDPPSANYREIPDLSIYDAWPDIETYITNGKFSDPALTEAIIQSNYRNFFCFSILKCLPLCLQDTFYLSGNYNQALSSYDRQIPESKVKASGSEKAFWDAWNVLDRLPDMTRISENSPGGFLMMSNLTAHSPMILQLPEYTPALTVDNSAYDSAEPYSLTENGRNLHLDDYAQTSHYHVNMAALQELGQWFDWLRTEGLYDNTRIILVSDHGYELWQMEDFVYADEKGRGQDLGCYLPLLMVKDFDSHGFTASEDFMTTADVPLLALDTILEEPLNPFTGNPLSSESKSERAQYILTGTDFRTGELDAYRFLPGKWFSVSGSIYDKANWQLLDESQVLPLQ